MLSFTRMVAAASCIVLCVIENTIHQLMGSSATMLQGWIFLEWLGYRCKDGEGDILLTEILPLLAQIMLMIKVLQG